MEAIIFSGIQASGKTSFYRERFFSTHVCLSLDMLRTRHRARVLFEACLAAKQPLVIDNTNPAVAERARYIVPAHAAGFRVIGYYFRSDILSALRRNEARVDAERIPDKGIYGTHQRLQTPTFDEGFDELWYVSLTEEDGFSVEEWKT